jgi:hypothetical protein
MTKEERSADQSFIGTTREKKVDNVDVVVGGGAVQWSEAVAASQPHSRRHVHNGPLTVHVGTVLAPPSNRPNKRRNEKEEEEEEEEDWNSTDFRNPQPLDRRQAILRTKKLGSERGDFAGDFRQARPASRP